jgi:hypothetical protein
MEVIYQTVSVKLALLDALIVSMLMHASDVEVDMSLLCQQQW